MKNTFLRLYIPLRETHSSSSELLDKPSLLSDTQMAPSEQFGHHLLSGRQAASDLASCISHICRTRLPGQLAPKLIASPAKEPELSSSSLQSGCGLGIINNTVQTARWTACRLSDASYVPTRTALKIESEGLGRTHRVMMSFLGYSGKPLSSSWTGSAYLFSFS